MRDVKFRLLLTVFLTSLIFLITPTEVFAVIQNLNGQTGMTQTFQNDSNLTISSSSNTHSLGWQGLLPLSRGGTGAGSFTSGSILFSNGTTFAQDNSNLFWDNINKRLGIGTSSPTSTLTVNGDVDLGTNTLTASLINLYNVPSVGSIDFYSDNGTTLTGSFWVESNKYVFNTGGNVNSLLDFSSITFPDKTFSFPDTSGTFGLLEANQTFTGLNKFESNSNSTIYVGSSIKTGCIALGDSDGNGVTYVTANDGVLTASTTKPSFCQ